MSQPSQDEEPRNERVSVAVTANEKRAIELVSRRDEMPVSVLLREMPFPRIIVEGEELMARLREHDPELARALGFAAPVAA